MNFRRSSTLICLSILVAATGCRTPEPCHVRDLFFDGDGDGWGGTRIRTCAAPFAPHWSTHGSDCDDADPTVHPLAGERCDRAGRDEDCDGFVDDDDPGGVREAPRWAPDTDGDGYGDEDAETVLSCRRPEGYVDNAADCADHDPFRNPDAVDPCPYDGRDEDCSGDLRWYVDRDGDGYGDKDVHDCLVPRAPRDGDCDDADPSRNPGVSEICGDGIDQDCDGNAGSCGVEGEWTSDGWTPGTVDGAVIGSGDLDGDGFVDLVAYGDGVFVVQAGPFAPERRTVGDARLTVQVGGSDPVLLLADLDGDGRDEVVAGGRSISEHELWASFGARSGSASTLQADAIVSGATLLDVVLDHGDGGDVVLAREVGGDGDALVLALAPGRWSADELAVARIESPLDLVALGDVNGDGIDDLARRGPSGVSVAHGPLTGVLAHEDGDRTIDRPVGHAWELTPFAPGDLDGDGRADLAVSDDRQTWLLHAPVATSIDDADAVVPHGACVLVPGGDLDADGAADLVIGQQYMTGSGERYSSVRVFGGPLAGRIDLEDAIALFEFEGHFHLAERARPVVADLDGDGLPDLAIGGLTESWLLFGGPGL